MKFQHRYREISGLFVVSYWILWIVLGRPLLRALSPVTPGSLFRTVKKGKTMMLYKARCEGIRKETLAKPIDSLTSPSFWAKILRTQRVLLTLHSGF